MTDREPPAVMARRLRDHAMATRMRAADLGEAALRQAKRGESKSVVYRTARQAGRKAMLADALVLAAARMENPT